MRIFQSKAIFDVEQTKWAETFKIDGQEVDADTYFFEQNREKELEIMKLKNRELEPNPCECRCCEDDEFTYEDLLETFANKIMDAVPYVGCVMDVLGEFAHIFLPDVNDEVDDDCGCDCINCTIDRFTEELQELMGGCSGCIREVLCDFFETMVDHIIIESLEED